jgi:hypothetical protein
VRPVAEGVLPGTHPYLRRQERHHLELGTLSPQHLTARSQARIDIVVCGSIKGSAGTTLDDAIAHGDPPGASHVPIDGELVMSDRSRQRPPPAKRAFFSAAARLADSRRAAISWNRVTGESKDRNVGRGRGPGWT